MKSHQIAALHMLRRYPEFKDVTSLVLQRLIDQGDAWAIEYGNDAKSVISYFQK
jgi:hypothetical protein